VESSRRRHLARIAAAAATGRRDLLAGFYRAASQEGVPVADLQEATLQVFLFAGYPRTIDAFEELASALHPPAPPVESPVPEVEARGRRLFGRIYGRSTEAVLAKLDGLHPDFARFVLRDAYGHVLARPFLPAVERELLAVAMLAATGLDAQLRAHVLGARRVGASADEVRDACDAVADAGVDPALARERVERALATFRD